MARERYGRAMCESLIRGVFAMVTMGVGDSFVDVLAIIACVPLLCSTEKLVRSLRRDGKSDEAL